MQHIVTTSSTASIFTPPDHARNSSPRRKPSKTSPPRNWPRSRDSSEDSDRPLHPINMYSNQAAPQGLPKFQSGSFLPRASPSTSPDNSMTSDNVAPNSGRWRLNSSGQLVDSDVEAASWALSDDIGRLKIGNGSAEELDGQIRSAQAKTTPAAVVQLRESSPLESSPDASLDSSSPQPSDQHLALPTHTRESSADSTPGHLVNSKQTSQAPSLTVNRDRPHSYSGGLSTADLRRLQSAGPAEVEQGRPVGSQDRQGQPEQESTYPSLATHSRQQPGSPELQVDYAVQQRQFQPISVDTRVGGTGNAANFRSSPPAQRFNPQGPTIPANGNVPYGMQPQHAGHLSLGNNQQVYDMMVPSHENPAVARVQQQHNVYRGSHQHSASDPLHLREAAAALNGGMPPFAPGMYPVGAPPPVGMYPGQFFAPQEAYSASVAQLMRAAAMQTQYPPHFTIGIPGSQQNMNGSVGSASPTSLSNVLVDPSGNGPSANNRKLGLYKTELCRSWEEKGTCRYGPKCQFAHGEEEVRRVSRHPKYKTEICRTFWVSGSCPYGKRCCFIHTELPASGAPPGADGSPVPQVTPETRSRSDSDPNEAPISLLQRISAKRNQEGSPVSSGGETTPSSAYPTSAGVSRQTLRVDTSSLDQSAIRHQNKSAFPTFAQNGMLFRSGEKAGSRSPGPVTAGPDLGSRQRTEFMNYTQPKAGNNRSSSNSSVRHSFNGTEMGLSVSTLTPTTESGNESPFATPTPDLPTTARPSGHARSGSAGNWGSFTRAGHLPPAFHGPQTAAPGNENKVNVPWMSAETPSATRYAEKAW